MQKTGQVYREKKNAKHAMSEILNDTKSGTNALPKGPKCDVYISQLR